MPEPEVVCTACGYRGQMRSYGCAQIGITVFLAIFMILPACGVVIDGIGSGSKVAR